MLTKDEALEIVKSRLDEMSPSDDVYVVVDEGTIEKPYGWVFFYNSKTYLETDDYRYQLAGNGPVIVNKSNGTAEFFGASESPEVLIAEYEKNLITQ